MRAAAILICVVSAMTTSADAPQSPIYADKLDLMNWIDEDGTAHQVKSIEDWQRRRAHILGNMQRVMGPHPGNERRTALDMQVLEEVRGEGFTMRKISFATEPGDRVPALLFIPDGLDGLAPAMLCLHQTTAIGKSEPGGLGGLVNLHYARELAERGYVTLAPDYPRYGDYQVDAYAMGYVSATMKGIWNHQRAVDLLASLPEVDAARIGCVGHSLGGHNSLFVAAFDERIKVVVTSCGFNSFAKYKDGDLTGWSHQGYMPRIASEYCCEAAQMPFDFSEVLGAIAPRAVFVNAPVADSNFELSGVQDCLNAARPVYELYGAGEKLVAAHPECGHDFPVEVRERAWEFVTAALQ